MKLQLEGSVTLVVGGASGIGKACALRFAEEGAEIVISDLGSERLESAAAEIRSNTNGQVKWVEANVCFEDQIVNLMQSAIDDFGHIDCLVASAGVSGAHYVSGENTEGLSGHLVDQPLEDWNQMIAKGNPGSIVNISSSAARVALPGAVDYCVSKAGVSMLTQAFAMEVLENKIRVNAIGPGYIETPMTQGLQDDDEGKEMMHSMTPMGRLGTPLEMANTALYLSCDESSYTTGATLYPNGGLYIS